MKQKYTELPSYILLSVIAVILAGILIFYMMNFFHSTVDTTNTIVNHAQEIKSDYEDYDITMFDQEEVRGSDVVNFIKKQLGDYSSPENAPIYIQVETLCLNSTYKNTYENNTYLGDIKNFTSTRYYIKPTAVFFCKVMKNTNKAIVGVKFKQK